MKVFSSSRVSHCCLTGSCNCNGSNYPEKAERNWSVINLKFLWTCAWARASITRASIYFSAVISRQEPLASRTFKPIRESLFTSFLFGWVSGEKNIHTKASSNLMAKCEMKRDISAEELDIDFGESILRPFARSFNMSETPFIDDWLSRLLTAP